MKSKLSQQLIRDIAKKHNLTHNQVELIVKSAFEFQHNVLRNIADKSIFFFPRTRIQGFGTFDVPVNKKKILLKYKDNARATLRTK